MSKEYTPEQIEDMLGPLGMGPIPKGVSRWFECGCWEENLLHDRQHPSASHSRCEKHYVGASKIYRSRKYHHLYRHPHFEYGQ